MPQEIAFQEPFTQWGWKVGLYVALIGMAGGAYLVAYASDLLSTKRESRTHGRIAKYGYLTGLVGVGIGGPILLSHLATPFRAMLIPLTMSNLGSWMAIGSYMILFFGLGGFLLFGWTAFGRERPNAATMADGGDEVATDGGDLASDGGEPGPAETAAPGGQVGGIRGIFNRVGILGVLDNISDRTRPSENVRLAIGAFFGIFAFGTLVYSAMAFGSGMTSRVPLWDKTFLVPVQILSGLGAGLFAALGLAAIEQREPDRVFQNYSLVGSALLGGTLLAILATILLLPDMASDAGAVGDQAATAQASVDNLLGTYAWLFVGLGLVGGIILPIVLSLVAVFGQRRDAISMKGARVSYGVAAVLVVVGKIALAMAYLMAAEFTAIPLPT